MKAKQILSPPANWNDFESLCKELWGEIWNCQEIQLNGRLGQKQQGVDIFGIPENETQYYGIQCKGKNANANAKLTEKEIDNEIAEASRFSPSLKKLYIATTASNDTKIQEFVRLRNIEHISKGQFEVHLYCWEEITHLICSNQHTYNFYVNSRDFKINQKMKFSFVNDEVDIVAVPEFKRITYRFKYVDIVKQERSPDLLSNLIKLPIGNESENSKSTYTVGENKSYFQIRFKITNCGHEAIEEFKIIISFNELIENISKTNEIQNMFMPLPLDMNNYRNTYINLEERKITIIPEQSILVSEDSIVSDLLFFKSNPQEENLILEWTFLSKNFKDKGVLNISVKPKIVEEFKYIELSNSFKTEDKDEEVVRFTDVIIDKERDFHL